MKNQKQKGISSLFGIIIVIVVAILAIGGVLAYQYFSAKTNNPPQESTTCTEEAKVCPDGSFVSRTGQNCEFAACPSEYKVYSVDELVEGNTKEGVEVLVRGRYNGILINAGPDYEGPGGGYYLFGEKKEIHLELKEEGLKDVELNQIITVKGKVRYCGGKKIAKYICGLTKVTLIDETANWETYTNKTYDFSIKYPKDWRYFETTGSDVDQDASFQLGFASPETYSKNLKYEQGDKSISSEDLQPDLSLYILNNNKNLSLEKFAKEFIKGDVNQDIVNARISIWSKAVGGTKTTEIVIGGKTNSTIYLWGENMEKIFAFGSDNKYSKYKNTLEQMLSSFRFLK